MPRGKKNTEPVEGNNLDTVYPQPTETVAQAVSYRQLSKDHAKLVKANDNLAEKFAAVSHQLAETKKQMSDLKNFLKAKYKDGYNDGYQKGYKAGGADAKKQILSQIKGA